jgi:hypothetical protein
MMRRREQKLLNAATGSFLYIPPGERENEGDLMAAPPVQVCTLLYSSTLRNVARSIDMVRL